jgi:UDP-GlcNAc:undecaprenyl-phosphate/decaprenyl-phosphate GlcNAc-1-phosphate transferase
MCEAIRDYNMFDRSQLVVPLAALLIGACALKVVRRIALAMRFVDKPDRWRKLHEAPIPLGGGLAVWLATWSGWGVGRLIGFSGAGADGAEGGFAIALAIASFVMLGVGAVDDWYGLRARHKLAGQIVAASILVGGWGLRIGAWSGFGLEVNLGIFSYPAAVLWVVLVINAFNLVDGMDGFCGSLGLVAALGIALLAYQSGRVGDAILALALAGGLAAFLRVNLPPARIYLGDAGSMTIGLMICGLAVRACSNGSGTVVAIPPLFALLTLPLLDVAMAIGRRSLTGRSIFTPDCGHLHHCLRSRLGGPVAALGAAGGLAALGAAGAALARLDGMGDLGACLAIVISVGLLMGTNTFGKSEWRLLMFQIRTALVPLLTGGAGRRGGIQRACHLHGIRDWTGVWDAMVHEFEDSGVWRVELAIDLPAAGEVYHGLWTLPTSTGDGPSWSVAHTLHARGAPAGILRVAGDVDECRPHYLDKVEGLVRILEGHLESAVPPAHSPEVRSLASENIPATASMT